MILKQKEKIINRISNSLEKEFLLIPVHHCFPPQPHLFKKLIAQVIKCFREAVYANLPS